MDSIANRYHAILERVDQAAQRSGRSAESITVVAVSKTQPHDALIEAYAAGVRHFGENRSAEFAQKVTTLARLSDANWHYIGNLQTRQSLPIAQYADQFHAVDRLKIAQRLSRQLVELDRTLPVFIEVNVSGEASKHGFQCGDWEDNGQQRDALLHAVATISALPRIAVQGLMTMAPWGVDETIVRTVFQRTRALDNWLCSQMPDHDWQHLSMGMTDDFEIAIEEGATHVRIGRAIFGERTY
jgi:pyridoxal phosphate enzyme (YggS family)